jgi:hypothetical protein
VDQFNQSLFTDVKNRYKNDDLKITHISVGYKMGNYQSCYSTTSEEFICKMQRILDKLRSEIAFKGPVSRESNMALMRESQLRLMNYKELYLHRESIGEEELQALYEKMSVIEKAIADKGVSALTYIIEALD